MRIGINALFQARGGSYTNLVQLLGEWSRADVLSRHDFVLFTSRGTLARLGGNLTSAFRVVPMEGADRGLVGRVWVEQALLRKAIALERIDVLYCPANTSPLVAGVPTVLTLQNAAPFCESVSVARVGLPTWLRFQILGRLLRLSAQRATHVVFLSHYFRDLFVSRFGIEKGRTSVIYRSRLTTDGVAAASPELLGRYGIRRPYMLTVSHLYPYKNLIELIQAYQRVTQAKPAPIPQLVIVGADLLKGYGERVRSFLVQRGLDHSRVVLTGEMSKPDVTALLLACELFAFSSTCENCPTALIEALSAGAPVACSNIGVMPEIARDAAIYFDPFDVGSVAAALRRLMEDPALRSELRGKALRQAARFPSSAEAAVSMLRAIEGALQAPLAEN